MSTNILTPIFHIDDNFFGNNLFVKREDFIPFSFGGNKARKAINFFEDIDKGDYDSIVTYGSSSSNHCRIIANIAASRKLNCYIISPTEASHTTNNSIFMNLFNAKIITVPVQQVSKTINELLDSLVLEGKKPYFIEGGGHGNLGTQAYVDCYDEIIDYETINNMHFDYIFFASGTGTTQAGLVCGKLLNNTNTNIIGISIARRLPYGRNIILKSIYEYLEEKEIHIDSSIIDSNTIFLDQFICNNYGLFDQHILDMIRHTMIKYGLPLDSTYTGKAFYGMFEYINEKSIRDKNILFIHTGGTPLFFDCLKEI